MKPILWEGCPNHFFYFLGILPSAGFGSVILLLTLGLSFKIFSHFPPVSYSPGTNKYFFILLCLAALAVGAWISIRYVVVEPYRRWSEWHGIKYVLTDQEACIMKGAGTTIIPFSQMAELVCVPSALGKKKRVGSLFFKKTSNEILPIGLNIVPSQRPLPRAEGFECIENYEEIASLVRKYIK